jgi:hypothetical protein
MSTKTLPQVKALVKCGKQSLVGYGPDGQVYVHRLFCHRWDCPVCGKHKAGKLFGRLHSGQVTCTYRLTYTGGWFDFGSALTQFVRKLRYHYPDIQYLMLLRDTDGRQEALLVVSKVYPFEGQIISLWHGCQGDNIVALKMNLTGEKLTVYVAEYLSKMKPGEKHVRMMRTSRMFFEEMPSMTSVLGAEAEWHWQWDPRTPDGIAQWLTAEDYKVEWLNENAFVAFPGKKRLFTREPSM